MQNSKKNVKLRTTDKTTNNITLKKNTERSSIDSSRRGVDALNKPKHKNDIPTSNGDKRNVKDKIKDNVRKKEETKSTYSASTPREFVQKTTTADIYDKNKTLKMSKNVSRVTSSNKVNTQRTNDFKSSSAVPTSARKISKSDIIKPTGSTQKLETKMKKSLPINVTVNSPIHKRKLGDKNCIDDIKIPKERKEKEEPNERQRTKTRTLDEGEVKILTPEIVDNNMEMANLSKKLIAKPKAFYVNLSADEKRQSSEEEMSYEDDFESYESDFDSYESTPVEDSSESSHSEEDEVNNEEPEENSKEERMLDSGHFDLRDTRSANKTTPMDNITETCEEADKKTSLTDEGFQEMSNSSGIPSIKTVHVDVLERPLFIDFTKSKDHRRKRRVLERLKQRATDILSMVTLHEITYSAFEMKPIPYDLFMATYGRSNYTQTAAQTFDDGITAEVQTEDVTNTNKWTQHPIKFSNNDVCLNLKTNDESHAKNKQEFSFLFDEDKTEINHDDDYKNNNLRVYLEQKDGAGSDEIMSHETYTKKLKCNYIDTNKLSKFLKKAERRISNILSINVGYTDATNLKQSSYPFSSGYLSLTMDNVANDKYSYLKNSNVIGAVFSKNKSNLIFTVHNKLLNDIIADKCMLCLWDLSVAMIEPIKVLIAVNDVKLGIFSGSTDGYFIGTLEDGSIHIWDLTEELTWCNENNDEIQPKNFHEIDEDNLSETEKVRQWNLKNRDIGTKQNFIKTTFQTSAFTTSAINLSNREELDRIVALQYLVEQANDTDSTQKVLGQLFALQRLGILTVWSVIQDKSKKYIHDPGKAYWSKMKLERKQIVKLSEHIYERMTHDNVFNLNTAKKRLAAKRTDRSNLKMEPRAHSTKHFDTNDRPISAASTKNSKILVENYNKAFDYTISCCDLKIMNHNNRVYYLIAKNCGEVLCCTRIISSVKVESFDVASPVSTITSIAVSPHNLPYFLAGTDDGIINLCSFDTFRVLLRLDCSSTPEKYLSGDSFVDNSETFNKDNEVMSIKTIVWSPTDPFCITALLDRSVRVWRLTHSDVHAQCVRAPATACVASDRALVSWYKKYIL